MEKIRVFTYFLREEIDPPITASIASTNPAIGRPVCCIGIVVVSAFNFVLVVGFVGLIGLIGFLDVTVIGVTP